MKISFRLIGIIHISFLSFIIHINAQNSFSGRKDYLIKVDSTLNDISYYKYYTYLDTTPPALEYEIKINDTSSIMVVGTIPSDTEPTFRDRYFTNINIDTTGQIYIRKAITAREIARDLLNEKYGFDQMSHAGDLFVVYVDDKYWMIECNISKNSMDGSIRIILSKYDGRIISWSNF
jgi:hypothetical protein